MRELPNIVMHAITRKLTNSLKEIEEGLTLALHDTIREKNGKMLINSFDFSEIYVYIFQKGFSNIIQYNFKKSLNVHTLLPYSLWEFFNFFIQQQEYLREYKEYNGFGNLLNQAPVQDFLQLLRMGVTDDKIISTAYHKMRGVLPIIEYINEKERKNSALDRFGDLLSDKKLTPIEQIVDYDRVGIHQDSYNAVRNSLDFFRPLRDINNTIDALTFAKTYALTDEYYTEDKYFDVVTHSSTPLSIYKILKWENDPLGISPLVRDPVCMLIRTRCQELVEDPTDRITYINDCLSQTNQLYSNISRIEELDIGKTEDANIFEFLYVLVKNIKDFDQNIYDELFMFVIKMKEKIHETIRINISNEDLIDLLSSEYNIKEGIESSFILLEEGIYNIYNKVYESLKNTKPELIHTKYKKLKEELNFRRGIRKMPIKDIPSFISNLSQKQIMSVYEADKSVIDRLSLKPDFAFLSLLFDDKEIKGVSRKIIESAYRIALKSNKYIPSSLDYEKAIKVLFKNYFGKYIAIVHGEIVDSDHDLDALDKRVNKKYKMQEIKLSNVGEPNKIGILEF